MELNAVLSPASGALVGLAMFAGGLFAFLLSQLASAESPTRRAFRRYVELLAGDVAFLRLPHSAERIAGLQLAAIVLLLILAATTRMPAPIFGAPLIVGIPLMLLRRARDRRVAQMEEQLDGWMMGLANTLRATPALGEAIEYSARMCGAPLSEEFDSLLKERRLGVALDNALRNAGTRIGSRTISAVLATLVIGRNTGGSLPDILETSAAQLREMARLDGVIRTKTAEGRGQAWVLALMPFGIVGAIQAIDHDFFVPLTLSTVGYLLIAIAIGLWLGAIFTAKKILEIDV